MKCSASTSASTKTFWREFLTGLVDRGLTGVRLAISDAHAGLIKAIRRCFQRAGWQRCRVHAMRIFPDTASVIRLVGALLVEINDEMIAADRRYIAAASIANISGDTTELSLPAAPRT